jgi:hypothetical protein
MTKEEKKRDERQTKNEKNGKTGFFWGSLMFFSLSFSLCAF